MQNVVGYKVTISFLKSLLFKYGSATRIKKQLQSHTNAYMNAAGRGIEDC